MVKVRKVLIPQTRRSFGCCPSLTPKTGASASSTAAARAKRSATPVNGGTPRSPTRITAQVVLQMRIRSARTAQVRARDGFTLGIDLVQHPWVRDGLAQVRQAGHPGHEALDSHAEAAVRKRSILTDIKIPLERLDRQVVRLDALEQQVVIVDALAAADDLAVPFRRQQVEAEHHVRVLGVGLHVEGLERRRE